MMIRRLAHLIGSPVALAVTLVALASGLAFGFSDTWWTWLDRAVYILTLWIAIVVQGAQDRDTSAIHRKLDELIRAVDKADDRLQGIERE
jgi:low affinity Fe/Cu permease